MLVIKVLFIISSHNFISLPSHKQANQHSLSTHTHKKTSHFHSIFLIYVLKHIYIVFIAIAVDFMLRRSRFYGCHGHSNIHLHTRAQCVYYVFLFSLFLWFPFTLTIFGHRSRSRIAISIVPVFVCFLFVGFNTWGCGNFSIWANFECFVCMLFCHSFSFPVYHRHRQKISIE